MTYDDWKTEPPDTKEKDLLYDEVADMSDQQLLEYIAETEIHLGEELRNQLIEIVFESKADEAGLI